jgi:hypothetical protein
MRQACRRTSLLPRLAVPRIVLAAFQSESRLAGSMITVLSHIATFPNYRGAAETQINVIQLDSIGVYVDIRLWRQGAPTAQGIRLSVDTLGAVIKKLKKARAEAVAIVNAQKQGAA